MPKNPKAGPIVEPKHTVGFLLRLLQHTVRQAMDDALRKQGVELSFAAVVALFGLRFEPGVTGAKLARRAFVSAQTMNSVLRHLELDGLIDRRPHPDSRRADSWSLTEAGLVELERAHSVGSSVFTKMLASFDAAEVTALSDYLRRCIHALGGGDDLGLPLELRASREAPPAARSRRVTASRTPASTARGT
jgi:DNA-binding MarR family transcriptional regulator